MRINQIEYDSFGNGSRILVILPGVSLQNVVPQIKTVAARMKRFTRDYTVYLLDYRGPYQPDYTMEDLAEEYYEAMVRLGFKEVCLYGTSMGGIVSQMITVRHPGFVKKLIVAASLCEPNSTFMETLESWIRLAQGYRTEELTDDFIGRIYGSDMVLRFHDVLKQFYADTSEEDCRHFLMMCEAMKRLNPIPDLETISCPALILGSEGDRVTTPEGARNIALRTGGRLVMYPASFGHCVFDEAPDFLDLVWEFCEEYAGFYGWETADVRAIVKTPGKIRTPRDLYDRLCEIWSAETCAPRLREQWTPENRTLGQCSISAFLAQDLFGGEVYGIPLPSGGVHCYNQVGECVFDLASEQFGDQVLCYENNPAQSREAHFADEEKFMRYRILRDAVLQDFPSVKHEEK